MSNINDQIYIFYEKNVNLSNSISHQDKIKKLKDELNFHHYLYHKAKNVQGTSGRYVDTVASIPTNKVLNHYTGFNFPKSTITYNAVATGIHGLGRIGANYHLNKFKETEKELKKLDPSYHRTHRFVLDNNANRYHGSNLQIMQNDKPFGTNVIGGDTAKNFIRSKSRVLHHLNRASGHVVTVIDNAQTAPAKFLTHGRFLRKGNDGHWRFSLFRKDPSAKFGYSLADPSKRHVWRNTHMFRHAGKTLLHTSKAISSVPFDLVKNLRRKPGESIQSMGPIRSRLHMALIRDPNKRKAAESIAKHVIKFQKKVEKWGTPKVGNPIGANSPSKVQTTP